MTRVRTARAADGVAMGKIHVEAWQVAYRDLMPASYLDSLDAAERGRQWTERLDADSGAHRAVHLVVDDDDDNVAGIASVGFERGGAEPGRGEVWMINVAPSSWGTGLASDLLRGAEGQLRKLGYAEAVLWVLEQNRRARRFYEKSDWSSEGGTKTDDLAGVVLTELRYHKIL